MTVLGQIVQKGRRSAKTGFADLLRRGGFRQTGSRKRQRPERLSPELLAEGGPRGAAAWVAPATRVITFRARPPGSRLRWFRRPVCFNRPVGNPDDRRQSSTQGGGSCACGTQPLCGWPTPSTWRPRMSRRPMPALRLLRRVAWAAVDHHEASFVPQDQVSLRERGGGVAGPFQKRIAGHDVWRRRNVRLVVG